MKRSVRIFEVLLAAALCFAFAFSAYVVAGCAGHECSGEHCLICDRLTVCSDFLQLFLFICGCAAAVCLSAAAFSVNSVIRRIFSACDTLVSRKIKLTD